MPSECLDTFLKLCRDNSDADADSVLVELEKHPKLVEIAEFSLALLYLHAKKFETVPTIRIYCKIY